MSNFVIRSALVDEAQQLTELSFASKRYWDYPERYFDTWAQELTITPDRIDVGDVYVYEEGARITGYYSLITLESDLQTDVAVITAGTWLEHMFVTPERIGTGIGSQLFIHLCTTMQEKNIDSIGILADPNARDFYIKMGCAYIREFPSSIEGRTTPYLRLSS